MSRNYFPALTVAHAVRMPTLADYEELNHWIELQLLLWPFSLHPYSFHPKGRRAIYGVGEMGKKN